jgi:excisionase family DNA binding protein
MSMSHRGSELLTYPEAAALIGVQTSTLQIWVSRGNKGIPYLKIGTKIVRFRASALAAWLKSHERGGASESEASR